MMIETATDLAHAMNMNLFAEGAEDRAAAEILRDTVIGNLPGDYFGRPVSHAECVRLTPQDCPPPALTPLEVRAAAT